MPLITPMDELVESNMTLTIRAKAAEAVLAKAVELNIGRPGAIVVRDAVMGDITDASVQDWKDVEPFATAQVAAMEIWAEDATDITANDLSAVIKGGGTTDGFVENKAVVGVFGFFDRSPSPSLTAIRFKRGSNTLDWWQVEQCYVSRRPGGMIQGVILWEENDPLTVDMNFINDVDHFVGLYMIVAERYDQHISAP